MIRAADRQVVMTLLFLVASALSACSPAPTPDVLVRVGDVDIDTTDLERYVAGLPPQARRDTLGVARVREYLQTLVDRALLLAETRRRGLDGNAALQARVQRAFDDRLARQIRARDIEPRVAVDDDEIAAAYAARNWGRSLRAAHIFVRSDSLLAVVRAELAAGVTFDLVARRHSQDPQSAARGGLMPNFYTRATATAAVRDALFALPVGAVSEPLRIDKGYEIFQVLEERPLAFASVASRVRRELEAEARVVALGRHLDSLSAAYGSPAPPPQSTQAEATRLLAQQARDAGLHETAANRRWLAARREETMIRALRQQAVTMRVTIGDGEVRRFYEDHQERYSTADEVVLAEVLLPDREAAEDVLDDLRQLRGRAPAIGDWVDGVHSAVEAGTDVTPLLRSVPTVTDEDVQAFAAWLTDLLETPVGRADFVSELMDAASPSDLIEHYLIRMYAMSRSQRPGSYESQGHYHIRYFDPGPFARLVEAAMAAGAGRLIGPLEVDGGFSVAKVLVAAPRQPLPLEEVAPRIRRHLIERRENEAFHEYLMGLRRDATEEVSWFDERIRRATADLDREPDA